MFIFASICKFMPPCFALFHNLCHLKSYRRFLSSMAPPPTTSSSCFDKIMWPSREVQGMLEMDKAKFGKTIEIPYVRVPSKSVNRLVWLRPVQEFIFEKMPRLKPFRDTTDGCPHTKMLFMDPDKFAGASADQRDQLGEQIGQQIQQEGGEPPPEFRWFTYRMEYEDWDQKRCIRAVLPDGCEFSGFEQCGHIIHVNLREPLLPFGRVLGQILLDKVPRARTVVNKLDMLNNQFRVMDMELLAGEPDYRTELVENGIRYKLDFSKVYWNSRLYNVHAQTVEKFDKGSVVFDIFAGIGPFVLPAVKSGGVRRAFANDLNPAAIDFLRQNIALNKIPAERIDTFVMDGAKFIQEVIPEKVANFCNAAMEAKEEEGEEGGGAVRPQLNFHAVMNLPTYSADYLATFRGILSKFPQIRPFFQKCPFWIHCHFFVKAHDDLPPEWYEEEARRIVRSKMAIPNVEIQELIFNRKVASRKDMFCARIRLPPDYAFVEGEEAENGCREVMENINEGKKRGAGDEGERKTEEGEEAKRQRIIIM